MNKPRGKGMVTELRKQRAAAAGGHESMGCRRFGRAPKNAEPLCAFRITPRHGAAPEWAAAMAAECCTDAPTGARPDALSGRRH